MVDMVRAEKLKAKMRHVLFPALNLLLKEASAIGSKGASKMDPMTLWKNLKNSRRNPNFQRAVYAIELGFPNHHRMYRACLLVYGKTPSQIEWLLIEEFLTAVHSAECIVHSEQQQQQKQHQQKNSPNAHNSRAVAVEEEPPESHAV